MAALNLSSRNGGAPVNACGDTKKGSPRQSHITYLNHNHCEREHVRFLAIFPTLQDLWRIQVLDSNTQIEGRLSGTHIRSDCSDGETHNLRATLGIHEHI